MEKNYESCSFRLHDMLENVKIVTTRPGRFCYKNVCRYGLHSLILNTSSGSTRISEPLSLISTSNVHNDKYIYYYEYLLHFILSSSVWFSVNSNLSFSI